MQRHYNQRSVFLDVFRTLSCALIVIWHIAEVFKHPIGKPIFVIPDFYTLSLGGFGVTLFLILSGLVLQLSYGGKKYSYFDFISKRIFRIFPTYWFCLVLSIILYLYREWFLDSKATYFAELTLREWACSLSGTCAYLGWWGGPFLVTGWFISLILGLYLLFPFISRLFAKSTNFAIFFAFIVSFTTLLLVHFHLLGWGWSPQEWIPFARLFEFSIGIWLATVTPKTLWYSFNTKIPFQSTWHFLSDLSFPFFLIHFQLRFLLTLVGAWIPNWFAILIFFLVSAIFSHGAISTTQLLKKHTHTLNFFPFKTA